MQHNKIFLSHTSNDKTFVEWLAKSLRLHGLAVWFDKWEIKVGNSIVELINKGLTESDSLVIVLSAASVSF